MHRTEQCCPTCSAWTWADSGTGRLAPHPRNDDPGRTCSAGGRVPADVVREAAERRIARMQFPAPSSDTGPRKARTPKPRAAKQRKEDRPRTGRVKPAPRKADGPPVRVWRPSEERVRHEREKERRRGARSVVGHDPELLAEGLKSGPRKFDCPLCRQRVRVNRSGVLYAHPERGRPAKKCAMSGAQVERRPAKQPKKTRTVRASQSVYTVPAGLPTLGRRR